MKRLQVMQHWVAPEGGMCVLQLLTVSLFADGSGELGSGDVALVAGGPPVPGVALAPTGKGTPPGGTAR